MLRNVILAVAVRLSQFILIYKRSNDSNSERATATGLPPRGWKFALTRREVRPAAVLREDVLLQPQASGAAGHIPLSGPGGSLYSNQKTHNNKKQACSSGCFLLRRNGAVIAVLSPRGVCG